MILLDAYPILALLLGEDCAGEVEELLGRGGAAIVSINLAEVGDVCVRRRGLLEADVRATVDPLVRADILTVLSPGAEVAWRAASIRSRLYRPRASELSLADCFLLAAAGPDDSIATADPPVAAAARELGIDLIALPDSTGVRP